LLLATAFSVPAFAQIETVVVTAEKRSQDVQTVPIAISVFNSEKRDAVGINSIQDMTNFTPGLQYSTSTDRISLRGVGRQTNVLSADASVANYDDGLYETFAVAAGRSSLDLDRVEVERGPQGTLSGRNAIAGALNEVTRRPNSDEFEGEIRDDYGNYNSNNLEGRISGPLDDRWAFSLYGDWDNQTQGYIKNIIPGMPSEYNRINDRYFDGQIQAKFNPHFEMWTKIQEAQWAKAGGNAGEQSGGWTPADYPTYEIGEASTGFNPGYGCTLTGSSSPYATANTTVGAATSPLPFNQACRNPSFNTPWRKANLIPYQVELPEYWSLDTQWTYHSDADFDIKYIGGASYYHYILTGPTNGGSGVGTDEYAPITNYTLAPSGLLVNNQENFVYQEFNGFFSNEINFISTGNSSLQWVAGIYQFAQHATQPVYTQNFNQPQWSGAVPGSPALPPFPFGVATFTGTLPSDPGFRRYDNRPRDDGESYAGFGQVDWQATDELKFTGGLRYSADRKHGSESVRLECFATPACDGGGVQLAPNFILPLTPENAPFLTGFGQPAVDLTQVTSLIDSGRSFTSTYDPVSGKFGASPATGLVDAHGNPIPNLPKGIVSLTTYNPMTGFASRDYDAKWSALTGTAGIEWQPDQATLVYGKYSRGYKAGGFNAGIFTILDTNSYTAAEHVDSFEVGAKHTFGSWLTGNIALFHYHYTDLQIPVTTVSASGGISAPSTDFFNVPSSISQGAELETQISPIENLGIIFNYSYLDAHVSEGVLGDPSDPGAIAPGAKPLFTDAQCAASWNNHIAHPSTIPVCTPDVYTPGNATTGAFGGLDAAGNPVYVGWSKPQSIVGNQLPNSAKNKVAVNVQYAINTDLGVFTPSVSYVWRDVQYGSLFTRDYNAAPAWDQVDARILFVSPDSKYEVIFYGKNITNNIGYDNGATSARLAGQIDAPCVGGGVTGTFSGNGVGTCSFVQGVNGPTGYGHVRGENSMGIVKTYYPTPPATFGVQLHYKF
jgi:iron complex outermembrane receptor protein